MGIKDALSAKTQGLGLGGNALKPPSTGAQVPGAERAPRTGPGQMLAVRSLMQESNHELDKLRAQLESYAGSIPAKAVEASTVTHSKYANRHEDEFKSSEFAELKREIERAGRNVQPILVRAVKGRGAIKYEVIYGHRRLRACQDLGLPVWIIIIEATDEELFFAMDMENRQRKNPSAFELGDSYRRALEDGLFTSIRQLATKLHIDHSLAAKAYAIATLPSEVLRAFPSPMVVQYRWGKLLSDAIQKDPEAVTARAVQIAEKGTPRVASEVLQALVGEPTAKTTSREIRMLDGEKPIGSLHQDKKGVLTISLNAGVVSTGKLPELEKMLVEFLKKSRD
jgi:ParB family chromosome partitioning protein